MNYEVHSFSVELATKIGLKESIILNHLWVWIKKNAHNADMRKDGKVWTYTSRRAMKETFPYLTERMIRDATDKLAMEGYIEIGNYQASLRNKSIWYTLTNKGYAFFDTSIEKMWASFDKISDAFDKMSNVNNIEDNIYTMGIKEREINKEKDTPMEENFHTPLNEKKTTSTKANETLPPKAPLPFKSADFEYWWGVLLQEKKWKGKSQHAINLAIGKLANLTEEQAIDTIKTTIENGWQGFFPNRRKITQPQPQKRERVGKNVYEALGIKQEE